MGILRKRMDSISGPYGPDFAEDAAEEEAEEEAEDEVEGRWDHTL